MRFNGLDLNLLVALDALLSERNLTAAARRINLSQPAMSAAIGRLRAYFKDDIFIMNGRKIVLTPLGEALAAPTRDILLRVKQAVATRDRFDPAASVRKFRIVISDFMAIIFFSRLLMRVGRVAPGVTFELVPFGDRPDELLRLGEIDFLIFPEIFLSRDFPYVPLFEEDLVCVVCQSNRDIGETLSFGQYMSMGHVAAQFGPTRKPSIEEWHLLEHGIRRRIDVAVHSFAQIPYMVVNSNRIATMHARLARHFAEILPLRILPLPFSLT